ncbi:MAG: CRISPR-associated endonuclease Cas1, partial [Herpetosiphonaceae bacterium]|nr:CRISPR-associated endonuclease Cas1 [Herpetosiphonaceae bacterium]
MPTLYLVEQGAQVSCDGERLEVRQSGSVLTSLPLIKIDQIVVFGNIGFSTPALKRLLDRDIEVVFLTLGGRFHGRLVGQTPPHVALRRMQYRRADDPNWTISVAREIVLGKLRNERALLQRLRRDRVAPPAELDDVILALAETVTKAERAQGRSTLMGLEGFGAKRYFAGLRALLGPAWGFNARVRRPPSDPVNVLLSLGYTLLLQNVLGVV